MFKVFVCTLFLISFGDAASMKKELCEKLSAEVLGSILGGAYNPHYMSVDQPIIEEEVEDPGYKRTALHNKDFFVKNDFSRQLYDEPAWNVSNHIQADKINQGFIREKRDVQSLEEWECDSEVVWIDLGPDYFPRFLRSVRCLAKKCWFSMYTCTPKYFVVKLLRRKVNYCLFGTNSDRIGTYGLSKEVSELWVWEEKSIQICCECKLV